MESFEPQAELMSTVNPKSFDCGEPLPTKYEVFQNKNHFSISIYFYGTFTHVSVTDFVFNYKKKFYRKKNLKCNISL